MTKRKLTKRQDDIRRGLRDPDRYDPRQRGFTGPWRMVKCKDGPYVDYDEHKEVVDYLRKSAEINPAQSPHDGIHTCSKGCKKQGCNRGLRDTIEEQNAQIEALKQDLLEKTAAVRHLRMERIHDLNQTGGQCEEIARLKAEIDALMTNPTSRLLRAEREENARLNNYIERLEVRNAELVPENARLKAEVERLTDAITRGASTPDARPE